MASWNKATFLSIFLGLSTDFLGALIMEIITPKHCFFDQNIINADILKFTSCQFLLKKLRKSCCHKNKVLVLHFEPDKQKAIFYGDCGTVNTNEK